VDLRDSGRGEGASERRPDKWSVGGKFAAGAAVLVVLSLALCGIALGRIGCVFCVGAAVCGGVDRAGGEGDQEVTDNGGRDVNRGISLLTVSVAGMLLSFGLCGLGDHFDHGFGTVTATTGSLLFLASLIGVGIGMILFLFGQK
jgi:drug/metabolite transporter (DMT)-like permease